MWFDELRESLFTKQEIEYYDNAPMSERKSRKWRAIDEKLFRSLKSLSQGQGYSAIYVISDNIELRGLHDGKIYTSKKKYYDSLKENGAHVVEAGEQNLDKPREMRGDYNVRPELNKAIQQHLRG